MFFSKTKDISTLTNTDVVYQIPCLNCPRPYVGETLQHLSKRVNHHKNDQASHKKDVNKLIKNGTALAKHPRDENHFF